MTLELSIYGLSGLGLGLIGLFTALVLALTEHEDGSRPFWLSAFLVGLSLPMLLGFFDEAGWLAHPLAFFPPVILASVAGPALYLYARLPWQATLKPTDVIHAVPIAIGTVTAVLWYRAMVAGRDPGVVTMAWALLLYLCGVIYVAMTLVLLRRYRRALRDHFSDVYKRRLGWLRFAAWGLLAVIATDVILGILLDTGAAGIETFRLILSLSLATLIFGLSLAALRHPARYVAEIAKDGMSAEPDGTQPRASAETIDEWRRRLEHVMAQEQPYLDNDLSMTQLAGRVELTPHNLSHLLNHGVGQTFYDYVNSARIEHACRLLTETDRNVIDIAFDSGFNNKASFYTTFKQKTGTTPRAYRLAGRRPVQSSPAA